MQHRDDKPAPAPSRPSLLSTEQQAEADRARAEARQAAEAAEQATLRASPARRSRGGWLAGGAAVAAMCVGAGLWLANDNEKTDVAAQRANPPDAALVTAAAAVKPAEPVEAEVPAAAILDQVVAPPPPAAAAKEPSLKDMLDAPSASAPAASPEEELNKLLAGAPAEAKPGTAKARAAAPAAAAKTSEKKKPAPAAPVRVAAREGAPKAPAKAAAKAEGKGEGKAVPKADGKSNDASLLAALVAHSKEREGNKGAASNASAPTSLKQCRQLNAAQAEQCRVRLCAGSAKQDAECKARLPAKGND